jgi:hypothetical protein
MEQGVVISIIREGNRCEACGGLKPVEERTMLCLLCFDLFLTIEARKRLLAKRYKAVLQGHVWARTV